MQKPPSCCVQWEQMRKERKKMERNIKGEDPNENERLALQQAIELLMCDDPALTARALTGLEGHGIRALDYLLPLLEAEQPNYRKRQRRFRLQRQCLYGSFSVGLALLLLGLLTSHPSLTCCLVLVAFSVILSPLERWLEQFAHRNGKHKRVLMALAQITDMRIVGTLLEDLDDSAYPLLLHLLPRMRVTDRHLLTPAQYESLLACLKGGVAFRNRPKGRGRWRPSHNFRIAILKALEQIGDARAIPIVTHLSHSQYTDLCTAARTCLEYLHATADADRSRQLLLRPSTSPDTPSQVLVRPAGQGTGAEPALLLRPSRPE